MGDDVDETISDRPADEDIEPERPSRRPWWKLALVLLLAALVVALSLAWISRKQIADDFISGELENLGLPARYEIESIGPGEQVLKNVVIGDPDRPDLTIRRVVVRTRLNFGLPGIGRITLERPRLHGSYRGGSLSFGSLDRVLFTESEEPFRLPDLALAIVDGRALLESDFGPVGIMAEGSGHLRGGFTGELAAVAPELAHGECRIARASLYGRVRVSGEQPAFSGPLRLAGLSCPEQGVRLGKSAARLDLTLNRDLAGAQGQIGLDLGALRLSDTSWRSAGGKLHFTFGDRSSLVARYDLEASGLAAPQVALASLELKGGVRSAAGLGRVEVEGALNGEELRLGDAVDVSLANAAKAGEGTLLRPVVAQIRGALLREERGSRLGGEFLLRRNRAATTLVVPRATIEGGSGQTLLSVSRLQFTTGNGTEPRVSGNFSTGGRDLPESRDGWNNGPAGV